MAFQREKQSVSASELLQALADGDDIQLSQCAVTGVLDINRLFDPAEKFHAAGLSLERNQTCETLTLLQSIVFDKCVFEENVVFSGPWSEPDSISVRFKSDVIFNSSVFKAQTRFRNAVFHGNAGFDGCTFGGIVTFKNSTFHKDAKFRTAVFNGYCLLGSTVFKDSARFANTHFAKGANFSEAKFFGPTDFGGVYSSSRAVPVYDSVFFGRRLFGEDESFWRFVKQSAQEAGYYHLAGECFYNERCAGLWQKLWGPAYDTIPPAKKAARLLLGLRLLPELVFGRLLFGYGERPIRVLMASALIIVFCAVLYWVPGSLVYRGGQTDSSFFQGLYFSTITFTTLGYGDLYPAPEGFCRKVAMVEALAGGCLMALFVVCLAKRFSRG
ncbi:MAG TPA: potassium channel family protein [Sedimentisphaerales bacterium]|nr:potassium channel family protein [Sedimentisphaerales bacterium]